jgi:hypothetical protein
MFYRTGSGGDRMLRLYTDWYELIVGSGRYRFRFRN